MFARQIRGAGLALAALALATSISITPAASAASPANIEVIDGDYDAQGEPWVHGSPSNGPRWIHVIFRVHNYGGSSSGNVLVYQYCKYNGSDWVLQKPAYNIAPLATGKQTSVWFDCHKSQTKGWPVAAKLVAIGMQEPAANRDGHNEYELTWPDRVITG